MAEELLIETLRALPEIPGSARARPEVVLDCAERHGLAGVVYDGMVRAGVALEASLAHRHAQLAVARELDHAAHLALLHQIDDALVRAGIAAAALKGPLLAERLYERPSARATSDVDLLVAPRQLDAAIEALAAVGYTWPGGPSEERFRREHHHLHLEREDALPLELHFYPYRGFGSALPTDPLLERRQSMPGFGALGVLAPPDELVYLAVHAAAHRFVRLGWLWDMRLLVEGMTADELEVARERARAWGYSRILAFTSEQLAPLVRRNIEPLGKLGRVRSSLVRRIAAEPARPLLRAGTRFVYSLALCDSVANAHAYASGAIRERVRGELA